MSKENLTDKSGINTEDMILNMGPQHPSTHGVLRLKIHTDGEVVSKIEPIIGYTYNLNYVDSPFVDANVPANE